MKIAGATLNQTPLDWKGNVNNIKNAIQQARNEHVDLLCLPELAITSYGCEDLFLSNWLPNKSISYLPEIINLCIDIVVIVGTPFRHEGKLYNCSCIIENQKIKGLYAKQHLANDGVHYETRWFKPWERGEVQEITLFGETIRIGDIIFEVDQVKVGIEICEDAWVRHELRPACRLLEQNVELILNPSASHFAMGKSVIRRDIVENSSKNFNCAYLHINMLGNEAGRMIYDGEIMLGYKGNLIARNGTLSFKDVNFLSYEMDFKNSNATYPIHEFEKSDPNLEFVKGASLGLFDYLRKSKAKGFVLSVSGGADSSACAILVSEMVRRGIDELGTESFLKKLGRVDLIDQIQSIPETEQVKKILNELFSCAYQASVHSSNDTLNSARELIESIGAKFYHWDIESEVLSYTAKIEHALNRDLTWEEDDLALQNIQARARSPIIWMLANINNALLLTTSNRSEGDVGYTTMDGDTSGSIAPIAAVHKHFIREWLIWAQQHLDYPSLRYVNQLKPTAELRPTEQVQTDEADLMPYHILVEIEILAIKEYQSPMEVFHALKGKGLEPVALLKEHIIKFYSLWSRNQWKRERLAPAFHLDDFNVDPKTWYRFPILSKGFEEELKELSNQEI